MLSVACLLKASDVARRKLLLRKESRRDRCGERTGSGRDGAAGQCPLPEGLPATRRAGGHRLAAKLSETFGGAATSMPNRSRHCPQAVMWVDHGVGLIVDQPLRRATAVTVLTPPSATGRARRHAAVALGPRLHGQDHVK